MQYAGDAIPAEHKYVIKCDGPIKSTQLELETKVHPKVHNHGEDPCFNSVSNVKALVGAFNQEKALVGAF